MDWKRFQRWLNGEAPQVWTIHQDAPVQGGLLDGVLCTYLNHRPVTLDAAGLSFTMQTAGHQVAHWRRLGRLARVVLGPLAVQGVTLAREAGFSLSWSTGEATGGRLVPMLRRHALAPPQDLDAATMLIAPGWSDLALGARLDALDALTRPGLSWALDLAPGRARLNLNGRSMEGAELVEVLDTAICLSGLGLACSACGCTDQWACDGGCSWVAPGPVCSACVQSAPPAPALYTNTPISPPAPEAA